MMGSLLTLAGQSMLVLAVAGLMVALLRKGSAAQRHCVWTVALGVMAGLLVWPSGGWTWREERVVVPSVEAVARDVVWVRGGDARVDWGDFAWGVWALGAGVLLVRLLVGQWKLERMRRRAVEGEGVLYSAEVSGPLVMGLWKPVVVLPVGAMDWDEERLRVVLLHERMHLERRDLWWMALGQVVAALYWMQPLVWWALREQGRESEQACDDGVVGAGVKASEYAGHLVAVATSLATEGGLEMARGNQLERRVKAMFSGKVSRAAVGKASVAFAVLVGVALIAPVAGWKVVAQEAASVPSVHGVVTDVSGARVPGARVTLEFAKPEGPTAGMLVTRREIGRTDAAGEFRFPAVGTGSYSVRVEAPGFARLEQTGVAMEQGKTVEMRLMLNLGGVRETVKVTGEARSSALPAGVPPPPPPPPPPPAVQEALRSGTAQAVTQSANGALKIRVGGNVMASKLETRVLPLYPADCKAAGVQGTVLLRAVIGTDGRILGLMPVNEFVDVRLRDAATEAVKQWRYRPTLLNGVPVEVVTEVEVNFTLEG